MPPYDYGNAPTATTATSTSACDVEVVAESAEERTTRELLSLRQPNHHQQVPRSRYVQMTVPSMPTAAATEGADDGGATAKVDGSSDNDDEAGGTFSYNSSAGLVFLETTV